MRIACYTSFAVALARRGYGETAGPAAWTSDLHERSTMPELRRIHFIKNCAIALLLVAAAGTAAGASRTLDRLRADGVIHLGYRIGAAPFSFKDRDGSVRGYSAELCTRIAAAIQKQLGLSALKVEWSPAECRGPPRCREQGQDRYRVRHDDDDAVALRTSRFQPAHLRRWWQRAHARGCEAQGASRTSTASASRSFAVQPPRARSGDSSRL